MWDYANRLIALGSGGATTTYGYDAFGSRVFQTTATSTTIYPFKWYSVASSTGSGATYATTTEYVFNGDTLVSTIDQQFASGVATGTAQTRYIHPDHLGSTNVVTNASGTVVQTLDYYPYGSPRINSGSDVSQRKYIGQFTDASQLDYLNARYYDGLRGQFLSEDPIFWEIGQTKDGKAVLSNPQAQNSYNYADGNPVIKKDPTGKCPWCIPFLVGGIGGGLVQYSNDIQANRASGSTGWAAYAPRSSWQEYNASIAAGMGVGLAGTAGILYGGLAATIGSAFQDKVAGREVNLEDAVVSGAVTVATGGVFKGLAGISPASSFMEATGRSFDNLPSAILRNEIRYTVANEVFGSSVSSIVQSRYQSVQRFNTSTGASTPQNQVWVTPSGAVVNWGGGIISGPAAQSTPAIIKQH